MTTSVRWWQVATLAMAVTLAAPWKFAVLATAADDPPPAPADPPPADPPPADPPPADPPADPPPAEPPPAEPPPEEPPPEDPEVKAQEAAEALKKEMEKRAREFNSGMSKASATTSSREKLLTDISAFQHPVIANAVIPWMKYEVEGKVRDTAIAALLSMPFPEVGKAAFANMEAHMGDIGYVRFMFSIIGRVGDPKSIPKLKAMLNNEKNTLDVQSLALVTLGRIKHRDAVSDLINLLNLFESSRYPKEKLTRKEKLYSPLKQALTEITGHDFPTGALWKLWWSKNEKTFQKEAPPEPKPPAPDEEK